MSVLQMSILTFLISFGFAGYAWCNWQAEKMRLNDFKEEPPQQVLIETCDYCGGIFFHGTACFNPDCPLNK